MIDIIKAEEIRSTVDTLTITGDVYERCGEINNGIDAKREALLLVPNDTGWFSAETLSCLSTEIIRLVRSIK